MPSENKRAIEELLASINEANLRQHLRELVGVRHPAANPRGLRKAAEYLAERMRSFGLEVREDAIDALPSEHVNVIGTVSGPNDRQPILLVGAHYDATEDSPGADDNASGLAVLLELARTVSAGNGKLVLQFVGFALEEPGFLGSEHYARRIGGTGQTLAGAIILECVGFTDSREGSQSAPPGLPLSLPKRGNFIGVVANGPAKWMKEAFEDAAKRYVPELPVVSLLIPGRGENLPDTRRSDHVPFWDRGLPGMFLTDTANFRNPHYHRPTDVSETLDLPFMLATARALAAAVAEMAGGPGKPAR